MSTASVPNTFVASTSALSAEVNANFSSLVSFLNSNTVHVDGSKAMSSNLDLGSNKIVNVTDPGANQDAATKKYVDDTVAAEIPLVSRFTRNTNIAVTTNSYVVPETEYFDTDGWWESGQTFTCPANGVYAISLSVELSSLGSGHSFSARLAALSGANISLAGNTNSVANDASNGGVYFLKAGDSFKWQISVSSASGSGNATATNMHLTIVRLGLI